MPGSSLSFVAVCDRLLRLATRVHLAAEAEAKHSYKMPGVVAKKAAPKRKPLSFSVDCSKPVDDRIMNISEFEKFLTENIKVSGKKGAIAPHLSIDRSRSKTHSLLERHLGAVLLTWCPGGNPQRR